MIEIGSNKKGSQDAVKHRAPTSPLLHMQTHRLSVPNPEILSHKLTTVISM